MDTSQHHHKWAPEDQEALLEDFPISGPPPREGDPRAERLAQKLGRTVRALRVRFSFLGLVYEEVGRIQRRGGLSGAASCDCDSRLADLERRLEDAMEDYQRTRGSVERGVNMIANVMQKHVAIYHGLREPEPEPEPEGPDPIDAVLAGLASLGEAVQALRA